MSKTKPVKNSKYPLKVDLDPKLDLPLLDRAVELSFFKTRAGFARVAIMDKIKKVLASE